MRSPDAGNSSGGVRQGGFSWWSLWSLAVALATACTVVYLHAVTLAYKQDLHTGWEPIPTSRLPEVIERTQAEYMHAVVEGRSPSPYQVRVLVPGLIAVLERLGAPFHVAWTTITLAAGAVFFFLLLRLLGGPRPRAPALAGYLYFALLSPLFALSGYLAEMFLAWSAFAVLAALAERGRKPSWRGAAALTGILLAGMAARESVAAGALAYAASACVGTREPNRAADGRGRSRGAFALAALAAALAVAILLGGRLLCAGKPSATPLDLPLANLSNPKLLFTLGTVFAFPLPFLVRGWRRTPAALRVYGLCASVLLLLGCSFFGLLHEARMWSSILLVLLPLVVRGMRS